MDNEKLSPEGQQAAFAEVVRQRYNSFMPKFINYLCRQYSFLSHSEAMDINIVLNKFRRQRNVQRHRASQKSH